MGRVACQPEVRNAKQAEGGYVSLTLNVQEETWDAQSRSWVPSVTQVPLSFYSKAPDKDAGRIRQGYVVIIDGHLKGRTYSSQGEQKTTVDLRVDNIDIVEPHLSSGASITPETGGQTAGKESGLQAGYREQARQAGAQDSATMTGADRVAPEPYSGPVQTVEQFDDDQIPF